MMKRSLITIAAAAATLGLASTALAEGETVAAYGNGQVAVTPTNVKSEAAIKAAVEAAKVASLPAAIADARVNAQRLADASGLNLGAILSVEEQQSNPYLFGGFGGFGGVVGRGGVLLGPFNGNFCGTISRPIVKRVRVNGRVRPRVVRRVRKCFVPASAVTTVEVTFRAAPKA